MYLLSAYSRRLSRFGLAVVVGLIAALGDATLACCNEPASTSWPMYRCDAQRSGYTPQSLPAELTQSWLYRAEHKPMPAWPRSDRQTFDWSLQPIVVDKLCYFGDSVTGSIVAIDTQVGLVQWRYFTDGPIRFAPAVFENLLLVASDDGHLYALDRLTGEQIWNHRGGPDHAKRLGNERMISRWPARGGPVVCDGKVYYAAGIWPTDGIYLYALDARSGKVLWCNEDSGQMYMPQPHGGANAESGVAAQGHLVATQSDSDPLLLVPTGRAVPAAFDRSSGNFSYFHLQKFGQKGASAVAAGDKFFANSGMLFDLKTGESAHTIGNSPVAMLPNGMVAFVDKLLTCYQWQEVDKTDRKGATTKITAPVPLWSVEGLPQPREIIVAGSTIVVGAANQVAMIDMQSREIVWRAEVDGNALALAAANGRLMVATDQGSLYCFSSSGDPAVASTASAEPQAMERKTEANAQESSINFDLIAKQLLEMAKFDEGYCLDFGCGDGRLAEALAQNSELYIVAIEDDPDMLRAARERLLAKGLLGSRVSVLGVEELSDTGLPNYFANLVVSQRALSSGHDSLPAQETGRLTRPYGGVSILGKAANLVQQTRGPLKGAGEWTHQYGTPGNATCSTDEHIKGTLGMLWFRDVDVAMPQRHGRGPGPLFYDGRLYSMGLHELACVDAYNGRLLWRFPFPNILAAYDGDQLMGTAGTNSVYCVADTGVYVRNQSNCLRLDRTTGKQLAKFDAPVDQQGKPGNWGYIACVNGVLVGSLADPEHVVTFRYLERGGDMSGLLTESKSLFGMDAVNGELKWRYDAEHSIRHNALAMDSTTLFLIDRPQAIEDRIKKAKVENHVPGILVALDTVTGLEKWRSQESIDGTLLALSEQHPVLLMGSQPTRFALESEKAEFLTAIDPSTGKQLWRRPASYSSRPMINGRTIYSEGGAWDLISGSPQQFDFKRSYGCGVLTGSKHTMLFRSATLGYFDFERQGKTENYGGIRPGCWINAIPAGGLVLMPDASAGCVCSYLNQAWFALESDGTYPPQISPIDSKFSEAVHITLTADQATDVVRYTLDGTIPTAQSTRYEAPILLESSTRIKARSFTPEGRAGRTVQKDFTRVQ